MKLGNIILITPELKRLLKKPVGRGGFQHKIRMARKSLGLKN